MHWVFVTKPFERINIGATDYSRQFVGTGEVEAWVTTTFCGPEAEVDIYGGAPIEADERVIAQMIERLGLHWT